MAQKAYATDEQLLIRYRTHEEYSQPKVDFHRWVVDILPWRGDEWVLDVGAGPGSYFALVQKHAPQGYHVAGDLSFGMAQKAHQNATKGDSAVHVLNMDVQKLPFPDDTFDVVLANHMLYHVPDLPGALVELRRVLRPSGCLVATTNSQNTMPEFDTLARRACTLLGYPKQEFRSGVEPFALESGTRLLARYFRAVARYDLPSTFHFTEAEPAIAYLDSLRALREPQLPEDVAWEAYMDIMEKQITRLIRHFGELQVHKLTGVLIATENGGFATEYLRRLNGEG